MNEIERTTTIELFAGSSFSGKPVRERLRVHQVDTQVYRLLQSPGLVLGIAKGDLIEAPDKTGIFQIVSRAGLICVQILLQRPVFNLAPLETAVETELQGSVDGLTDKQLVLSVPSTAGFKKIENFLDQLVKHLGGAEWFYGNIYDPADGVTSLNWWQEYPTSD
ncbi:DUF4265 domain-containing protein [Roseibium sp. SCPC15]|uniref:DUF4265 domain-containing protein n=1 Tax=Roseibium sp. SCP15 TaxID=3141376 RepID=UPI00333BF761